MEKSRAMSRTRRSAAGAPCLLAEARTAGKGETQPVTKTGECDGSKSAKVIACLQPNRRVDIEVVGTRIVK